MKHLPLLILGLAFGSPLYPCSIFKYTVDDRTYFCGNEDWTAKDPAIQTFKPKGSEHGLTYAGFGRHGIIG